MTDPLPPEATPPLTRRAARDAEPSARTPEPSAHDAASFQAHVRAARSEFESQVAQARDQFEEANERIKTRTGRDLIVAILISLAIGAVLLGSLLFLKWIFVAFALAASILGTIELTRAFQVNGRRVDLIPQLVLGSLIVVSAAVISPWLLWVLVFVSAAILVVWRLVAQMIAKDGRIYGDVLRDVVTSVFLLLYVPFLVSAAVLLLAQPSGEWWVLAFIIVVVATDTGAYASGILFGKHPMAPRISPKKTWEGFAGAVLFSLTAGVLLALFMLGLPWWTGLIFGAVILGTATAGDLGESMLKRDLGIKDMSSWLPGHGGVLDRLDSLLPSSVSALALYFLLSPLAAA